MTCAPGMRSDGCGIPRGVTWGLDCELCCTPALREGGFGQGWVTLGGEAMVPQDLWEQGPTRPGPHWLRHRVGPQLWLRVEGPCRWQTWDKQGDIHSPRLMEGT